jgi:uncharacterized caspase-like protein
MRKELEMNLPMRICRLGLLAAIAAAWCLVPMGRAMAAPVSGGGGVCADCSGRPPGPPVQAERRIALVVGNSKYQGRGLSLPHPSNDAQDITAVLTAIGFEVLTVIDATKADMDAALQRFARQAATADTALFFYAGHALQFQGRNYLMPTDGKLEDEISLRYEATGLEAVQAALERANGIKIIILDACRDNPLANRLRGAFRGLPGATRGLARIDKTQGMVVAYATLAGEVADDGSGRNSPFTTALLKWLQQPGLEIEMMFRRVASDVNTQTSGRQRPETYISLLSEYYLNKSDRIAWDRVKDSGNIAALRDFISGFPSSPFVGAARDRLATLEREDLAHRQQELREQEQRFQLETQKRMEEERKRREDAENRQLDEQKRQEDVRRRQEEQKRQDDARRQQDELKRQEDVRRQQEELKRQEEVRRQQQEEQKRQPPFAGPIPRPSSARPADDLPEGRPGEVLRDCSACPELVVVPAGEFLMGSANERIAGDVGGPVNEGPQHKVFIRQPIAVGRFEVTRDQFEAFVQASGYRIGDRCYTFENNTPEERANRSFRNPGFPQSGAHPAVCINWQDAKALRHGFAKDAAEACKFANGVDQSAKRAMLPANAYMACTDGYPYTAPVGSYAANAFGLFDLLGNAWEWTEDCFYDDYVAALSDGSARSAAFCANRAVRGGSWFSYGDSLRPAVRAGAGASARHDDIGFRVARPLTPPNAGVSTARP